MKIVTCLAVLCLSLCYINCKDLVTGDLTGSVYIEVKDFIGIPLIKREQDFEMEPPHVKLIEFCSKKQFTIKC